MLKTLTEQLHDLRVSFDNEKNQKQERYNRLLKMADDKISAVKNTDYVALCVEYIIIFLVCYAFFIQPTTIRNTVFIIQENKVLVTCFLRL